MLQQFEIIKANLVIKRASSSRGSKEYSEWSVWALKVFWDLRPSKAVVSGFESRSAKPHIPSPVGVDFTQVHFGRRILIVSRGESDLDKTTPKMAPNHT